MIKVVCWNIGWSYLPLDELLAMDDVDVALLQETSTAMPDYLASKGGAVEVSPHKRGSLPHKMSTTAGLWWSSCLTE